MGAHGGAGAMGGGGATGAIGYGAAANAGIGGAAAGNCKNICQFICFFTKFK